MAIGKNAISLLKDGHRKVEELFAQFEKTSGEGSKQKVAQQICMELAIHTRIEEEIFYPACAGKVDEDLLKEAYVEHDAAKQLIIEILDEGPKDDDYYDAKVQVLSEQIEHHVREEEKDLFPQVKKAGIDIDALGADLADRKRELMKDYKARGIPEPELTTID